MTTFQFQQFPWSNKIHGSEILLMGATQRRNDHAGKTSERLVGGVFRAALTPCMDCCGDEKCASLDAIRESLALAGIIDNNAIAKSMVGLGRCISGHGLRPLTVYPPAAMTLSKDERFVVSLLAACQNNDYCRARECALVLIRTADGVACVVENARLAAHAFAAHNINLSTNSIVRGSSYFSRK